MAPATLRELDHRVALLIRSMHLGRVRDLCVEIELRSAKMEPVLHKRCVSSVTARRTPRARRREAYDALKYSTNYSTYSVVSPEEHSELPDMP